MYSPEPKPIDFGVFGVDYSIDPGAQKYYRIEVLLRSLYELGLSNVVDDDRGNLKEGAQLMAGADACVFFHMPPELVPLVSSIQAFKAKKDDHGVFRCAPSIIYDLDDNLDWIHPLNPAFWRSGTRNWDGQLLKRGDMLTFPDQHGEERTIWEDGKHGMSSPRPVDWEDNHQFVKAAFDSALSCEGVTVPNERLAQVYRDKGAKEVHVFPNSIIPEDYVCFDLAPSKKVRILWQGGWSHAVDWLTVTKPLLQVLHENPNTVLVTYGSPPPWLKASVEPDQFEEHPWSHFHQYHVIRPNLNIDINLCPLVGNKFNECKSAIKWYEGSVGRRPEATLAANVPPYSDEMVDGETGLLYDTPEEFGNKLTVLIKNRELRLTLADRANKWVLSNRHYSRTVPAWFEFVQHLRSKKRMEALTV